MALPVSKQAVSHAPLFPACNRFFKNVNCTQPRSRCLNNCGLYFPFSCLS